MQTQPLYAVAPVTFRFRALAALSGRLALGGPREIALATLMAARLARDSFASFEHLIATRLARAAAARSWYSALALPAAVRAAALRVVQASEQGDVAELRSALDEMGTQVAPTCDGASRAELKRLTQEFGSLE